MNDDNSVNREGGQIIVAILNGTSLQSPSVTTTEDLMKELLKRWTVSRRKEMIHQTTAVASKLIMALVLTIIGNQAMAAGALAIDSNQGRQYGFAYNYPNMGNAEQRALSECGSGCMVVLRFSSGCGAYAADQSSGSTAYGWGTASSSSGAQNRAISECQSRGGTRCIVRSYGCNS